MIVILRFGIEVGGSLFFSAAGTVMDGKGHRETGEFPVARITQKVIAGDQLHKDRGPLVTSPYPRTSAFRAFLTNHIVNKKLSLLV